MRVVLLVLVAVIAVFSAGFSPANASWTATTARIAQSTVPLACSLHGRNGCTAFSINETKRYYLTAHHCVVPFLSDEGEPEVPVLDGQPLTIVFTNLALDLAIVVGPVARPALVLRTQPVLAGTEVGGYGYGYGMPTPIFRLATISAIFRDPEGLEWLMVDNALIGGMSGGPLFDRSGRVVGVNDKSDNWSGYSVSGAQIRAATEFW